MPRAAVHAADLAVAADPVAADVGVAAAPAWAGARVPCIEATI
jgi:hypothetical protein